MCIASCMTSHTFQKLEQEKGRRDAGGVAEARRVWGWACRAAAEALRVLVGFWA